MDREAHVTATEAARTFSSLISRVQYRGESFVVDRGGKPVCRIVPAGASRCTISDFVRLMRSIPRPDEAFAADVAAISRRQPPMPKSPWPR